MAGKNEKNEDLGRLNACVTNRINRFSDLDRC